MVNRPLTAQQYATSHGIIHGSFAGTSNPKCGLQSEVCRAWTLYEHPVFVDLIWLVVSNIFYFHPYLGKIPILTNIFQMG